MRVAPSIEDYEIKVAKKFKKKLPEKYAFIFEDPKEENEFYNYIKEKYNIENEYAWNNILVIINDKNYFLSFYETEKSTNYLNLFNAAAEVAVESAVTGEGTSSGQAKIDRESTWYWVVTVLDSETKDCLAPSYIHKKDVLNYLLELKYEYLNS